MNIKEKIIFFILGFHEGNINRVLHVIGILIMLYAIYSKNIGYVILSLVIMEYGHWHQYRIGNASYKSQVKEVVNIQLILIVFVLSVLSAYFYYF